MEQNEQHQKQMPMAPKKRMSDFWKALLITAVPIVLLCLLSLVGIFFFISATIYFVGVFVAIIVFAVIGKRGMMAGTLVGLAIGIIALGATCFASSATWGG